MSTTIYLWRILKSIFTRNKKVWYRYVEGILFSGEYYPESFNNIEQKKSYYFIVSSYDKFNIHFKF